MPRPRRRHLLAVAVLLAGCAAPATPRVDYAGVPAWSSRAIPEARGEVRERPDGKRVALRYRGWTTRDYGAFRTYAYDEQRPEPPVTKAAPRAGVRGDAARGRRLFLARGKGPCTGCHLAPGDDVWPAGNVGPDLSTIGDRGLDDAHLYQVIYDPRVLFPHTLMPPWGVTGALTPAEIVDVVAYLQTLRGPRAPEKDAERDPGTRAKPRGFGDNLDPTNNPAIVLAEDAEALWERPGSTGRACTSCHAGPARTAMRGVAARWPRFVNAYARVMSLEDFLAVHGPATTGRPLPLEGPDNLALTVLVKMASNGMPVAIDTTSPEARAALARGKATFERRVGQRNHACADCHTAERAAGKFLGGRVLADVRAGLTRHFPTWRTSNGELWDMRKRFQWCMTPLGMNMLPADAIEYAELELYLTSFDVGQPLAVPGIRH
jgi:sulfur-oxidizing protein SoxA